MHADIRAAILNLHHGEGHNDLQYTPQPLLFLRHLLTWPSNVIFLCFISVSVAWTVVTIEEVEEVYIDVVVLRGAVVLQLMSGESDSAVVGSDVGRVKASGNCGILIKGSLLFAQMSSSRSLHHCPSSFFCLLSARLSLL